MLKFFRTKGVTKFVLWLLLILILPAFVLFGTESFRAKRKGPAFVGTIGSKKVSFNELFESMAAVRGQLVLNYGYQPQLVSQITENKTLLAKFGWDRLIMLKEAGRNKIRVSDKEVAVYLRSHPLFIRNGRFDDRIYAYVLQYNIGLSARAFEEFVRQNLKITKLKEDVVKAAKADDKDKKAKALDEWLAKLSQGAKLNIDLNEIEKYQHRDTLP